MKGHKPPGISRGELAFDLIMPARKNQFKEFPAVPGSALAIAANNVRQKFFNSQFVTQRDSLAA
jgi:hypothetical protein